MGAKKYKYKGFTSDGREVSGTANATNIRLVKKNLRREGIRVRSVTLPSILDIDLGSYMVEKGFVKPFTHKDLARFTKQLSILINAGVPILEGLEILGKQEKTIGLKVIIKNIIDQIGRGKSLYEALSAQRGFTTLYTSLVKAGEAAGILDTILLKLVEFMDRQAAILKRIKSAMMYPMIVVVVGVTVTWGLMVFVVPQFVGILNDSNQEVPAITQFVIDVSDFMQEYTLTMMGLLVLFGIAFTNAIKTKQGKNNWDRFLMKVPLIGQIIIKGGLSNLFRTLSTMLGAGVPLIESLEICIETLDNSQMAKDLSIVKKAVVKGKSITEPLGRIKYFPPLVNQMVKVGESTGNLDEMLVKVADVFEEETNETIDNLTKLIEPIILVVLGAIVGTVLVAMYLPIFMSAGGA